MKYQLIETSAEQIESDSDRMLARGAVTRIGTSSAQHVYCPEEGKKSSAVAEILEHQEAIQVILRALTSKESGVLSDASGIGAVGHRVVHGGEKFSQSVLMDREVVEEIEDCTELAPLHNPHNLRGYQAARRILPHAPHAAVFDTAFHQTMPPHAYLYGLPYVLYKRHGIRRYGFHGTSHRYVSWRSRVLLSKPREKTRLISCHLGNGASIAAIDRGRSLDTSMGFTPLEGLLMGTRCGDIDPSLIFFTMHKEGLVEYQMTALLNKHSGLFGVSGLSNDMAELLEEEKTGHERAHLAIEIFCYRVKKYIAAYMGVLGGVHAIIFTGGIGENAPSIRERCIRGLQFAGVGLDHQLNEQCVGREMDLSPGSATAKVLVIPTNEELIIARDTFRLVEDLS